MISIRTAFGTAASGPRPISTFWLLFFAIAILDDAQRREDKRRKKRDRERERAANPPRKPKPPAGPRPC